MFRNTADAVAVDILIQNDKDNKDDDRQIHTESERDGLPYDATGMPVHDDGAKHIDFHTSHAME